METNNKVVGFHFDKIHLDKYKILGEIGKGNMGHVFLVEDNNIHKKYAMKIVFDDSVNIKALRNEYSILKELNTISNNMKIPDIIDYYENINSEYNYAYLVMEYIVGTNFGEYLNNNAPLETNKAYDYLIQISDIVSKLHSYKGSLIYFDLKPDNFILSNDNYLYLIDFGTISSNSCSENKSGNIFGTYGYSAPEQLNKGVCGTYTDIYSIGAIGYYMVTGINPARPPFTNISLNGFNNINSHLAKIINKCLQKDYVLRYENAIILNSELKLINLNEPTKKDVIKKRNLIIYYFLLMFSSILTLFSVYYLNTFLLVCTLGFIGLVFIIGQVIKNKYFKDIFIKKYVCNIIFTEKNYINL